MSIYDTLTALPENSPFAVTQTPTDRVNGVSTDYFIPDLAGDNVSTNSLTGSGFFSGIGSFFEGLGNTALGLWGQKNTFDIQKAQAQAAIQSSQQPVVNGTSALGSSDMMPLLIAGGVGVAAILIMGKK
ncbi:hypothetical protein [Cohaesibacter celericrescens]|uniref:Uncharacterized protein n=1 Tax=Cohaesibacter celericrescens TaxID=2067669 RepID=A0A2N5XLU9_9HYPH|nr:hypothetical protein [Cohaesibacter celericrescens]PLW75407.1 hypothetical protein C0081_20285 [Cohaesibacter celericrescens]